MKVADFFPFKVMLIWSPLCCRFNAQFQSTNIQSIKVTIRGNQFALTNFFPATDELTRSNVYCVSLQLWNGCRKRLSARPSASARRGTPGRWTASTSGSSPAAPTAGQTAQQRGHTCLADWGRYYRFYVLYSVVHVDNITRYTLRASPNGGVKVGTPLVDISYSWGPPPQIMSYEALFGH